MRASRGCGRIEPPVEPAVRDRWLTTTVYRLHVDDLRARRRAERHRSEVLVAVGHAGGAGGNGGSGGHGAGGHGGHSVGVGLVGIADLPSPFTWTAGQWGAGGDGGGGVPETLRGYAGVESPQLVFDP
jgi:hypothetical protein